jgi:S-(hydroxymethyl)mycothiol dehydrogenase
MATTSRVVIARGAGTPVAIETMLIPDPGPHDAVVRVVACGVCHSDLGRLRRPLADGLPVALGHETAGIVELVGDEVTSLAPGDSVIVAWRAPCGVCEPCRRGFAAMCESSLVGSKPAVLADGTIVSRMLGIGGFADRVFVAAAQCVKYDPAIRAEAAALVGCGVMTGFGATAISAPVRPGDSVAVFGCGGVGDAAIAGAHFAGASMIIAVDVNPTKLEWAKRFGATQFVDASSTDAAQAVRALPAGAASTSPSKPWAPLRPTSLRSRRTVEPARSYRSECLIPTPRSRCRFASSSNLVRRGPPGTGIAFLPVTFPCSSTSTDRAASTSTPSSPRRSL